MSDTETTERPKSKGFGKRYSPYSTEGKADHSYEAKKCHALDHIAYYLGEIERHLGSFAKVVNENDYQEKAKNRDIDKLAEAYFGQK